MSADDKINKAKESAEKIGKKVRGNELASHALSVMGVCIVLLVISR